MLNSIFKWNIKIIYIYIMHIKLKTHRKLFLWFPYYSMCFKARQYGRRINKHENKYRKVTSIFRLYNNSTYRIPFPHTRKLNLAYKQFTFVMAILPFLHCGWEIPLRFFVALVIADKMCFSYSLNRRMNCSI